MARGGAERKDGNRDAAGSVGGASTPRGMAKNARPRRFRCDNIALSQFEESGSRAKKGRFPEKITKVMDAAGCAFRAPHAF